MFWALRKEQLCDPRLCPDSPGDGTRCGDCPLDKLDASEQSEEGQLLQRALEMQTALRLGLTVTLGEIKVDEFQALQVLEEERDRYEEERSRK